MPHRKKKPFIEKKKAVSFHLVHRSQRDPLAADETAPQRVLLPTQKINDEERRAEQRKYGVFFDDDYDYLQHLKETSGPAELIPSTAFSTYNNDERAETSLCSSTGIKLPSSVFASEFEEDVGLLNKAAPVSGPRLDFDPDIVAALDDDFDFDDPDNILEDDFILQANRLTEEGLDLPESESEGDNGWEDMDSEEGSDDSCSSAGPLSDGGDRSAPGSPQEDIRKHQFWEEETKSRFTEYSMTSSVMRRNEQLTLHDERFEKRGPPLSTDILTHQDFYEQYDDVEIGALDNAEVEGSIHVDSGRLQEVLNDYYKEKAENCVKLNTLEPFEDQDLPANELDECEKEEIVTVVLQEAKEEWDCESICSTYSNLYNHPQLIRYEPKYKQIHLSSKTGIPLDVLPKKGLTAKQVERMQMINSSDLPKVSAQPRPKNESKEDKRARKQAIKEERKERRIEKKANKLAFKLEKGRQEKELLNLKRNVEETDSRLRLRLHHNVHYLVNCDFSLTFAHLPLTSVDTVGQRQEQMAERHTVVADGNQKLFPCEVCGRHFAADVLERHGPICKKLFNKKRKPFDSLKQRLQGTDIPTVIKSPQPKVQPVRKSNWRQHHEDFINVIRSAKQCTLAIREGRPLPPPPPPTINPDYIQCPYCMRRFNESAAQRHINFCKDQSSRCVFDPAQTAARLASRARGKVLATPNKQPTVTSAVGTLLQNRAVKTKNEASSSSSRTVSQQLSENGLATDPASGGKPREGFNKSSKKD